MELIEAINERWSCRRFDLTKNISSEQVEKLLNLAIRAPTAGNIQPWHFFIIRNEAMKQEIVAAAGYQSFIGEAPVVIVVCAELQRSLGVYGSRGRELYIIQDTAAAIQNILLGVVDMGLAACWVGAFDEKMISTILKLDVYLRPLAIIPIGRPAGEKKIRSRRNLNEVTTYID